MHAGLTSIFMADSHLDERMESTGEDEYADVLLANLLSTTLWQLHQHMLHSPPPSSEVSTIPSSSINCCCYHLQASICIWSMYEAGTCVLQLSVETQVLG